MKKFTMLLALLVFIMVQAATAQNRKLTGTVTSSEDGSTLPGVSVVAKGTTIGTITDLDGKYTLEVPADTKALVFTFVGMKTVEVVLGADNVVNITLEPDVKQVEEVVVTALGITRQKKALGYAVQEVKGDELNKAREANIVNSLNGRVSGVNVTSSSGAVGASTRIVLRGASSITGSNEPLFVVDGVPIDNTNFGTADDGGGFDMPNGIADINPDDIENVSVLKGPNAAALYGLRAANGVIVITTKKGKAGKSKELGVTINHTTMYDKPLVLPDFQNSYGQGPNKNFFQWVDGTNDDGGVDESWGPPLDKGLKFTQWNSYTVNGDPLPWVSHPNNIRDFYQTGIKSSTSVGLSGGADKIGYRLSIGGTNQKGMIPNTDYKQYNVGGNSVFKFSEKLRAGFNVNYTKAISGNLPTMGYTNENPVQQMIWSGRNVDFNALRDWQSLPLAPAGTPAAGTPINWNTQFQNNPFWVLDNNLNKLDKDRVIGGADISFSFTDYLKLSAKTGIDTWSSLIKEQKAIGTNEFKEGYYRETGRRFYEVNNELLLSFNKSLTSDVDFTFNFGGNRMDRDYTRLQGEAPQLELPGLYTLSNVKSGATVSLTSFTEESKINSLYGFGQVSYKNVIFFDFSGRNDWASVLPKNNNSFFYPSFNLSAIVTDLLGITSPTFTFLKVRAGWAKVGSIGALDPYAIVQTYQFRDDKWGNVSLPFNPELLNNPNLVPESKKSLELGFDSRLLDNKVRLDFTYYNSKSEDLIVDREVSAASGYIRAWDNVGEMTSKGFEIQLGLTPVQTSDLKVDIEINYAKDKNEVVSLGGADALILGGQWNVDLQARVGMPYGVLVGPGYLRDPDGNIIHENGLPLVDPNYKILGNIQPDWRGGLTFNIAYKGITLNTTFDAKMGGDIYTMTYTWGRYSGVLKETLLGRETGLIGDGVKNVGTADAPVYVKNDVVVSAKSYNQTAFDNACAEGSVFDASYIKWRQLTLTYTLPKKYFANTPIHGANIGLVGRNLAILFKNAPHIDPETGFSSENAEQGQEFGQLPSARSIGFNISINF